MDGKRMTFEKYEDKHLGALRDIYNYYVCHTTATWHYEAQTEAEMRELLVSDDDRYGTFVILREDEICGYVSIRQYKTRAAFKDTAEIGIYIRHDACGKGLGRLGLDRIESFALEKRFHVLIAAISGDNEGSIGLFERAGYADCGRQREVGKKFDKLLDLAIYQKIMD